MFRPIYYNKIICEKIKKKSLLPWKQNYKKKMDIFWKSTRIVLRSSTIWRKSIVYWSLHWSWDRNNEQNIGASLSLYAYLFFLTSWLVSFIIGSRTCIVIAQKLSPWSYIPQCCVFDLNTWCFISRYSIVATILERRSLQDALLLCV